MAERWGISPFELMKQDIDDFILIANRLVKNTKSTTKTTARGAEERIKVDDSTATGGWY
jgi:hypothetical protein